MYSESCHKRTLRLRTEDPEIFSKIKEGKVGLELETQRIRKDGHLAQTSHPFEEEPYIDRDFGEAQIEINTPPGENVEETKRFLHEQLAIAHKELAAGGELLWPFSGPPALGGEEEIRIAEYTGEKEKKTVYRRYLAFKYGKRKMTFCGIHFNYSFDEELLRRNFAVSGEEEFRTRKDLFYLHLAEKVLAYSWVPAALLSASPLVDGSFYSPRREGQTVITGYASMRCSEEGYWNPFTPLLSYEDISSYTDSILAYKDKGLLRHESEFYYPVRIKPAGKYYLNNLRENGVSHIELRMIDLNPLEEDDINLQDLQFLQLFLIWLASLETVPLSTEGQKIAIENQKAAARLNWEEIEIRMEDGSAVPLTEALQTVLGEMRQLFRTADDRTVLDHQFEKTAHREKRYAQQVIEAFGGAYLKEGIRRAEELQEAFHV